MQGKVFCLLLMFFYVIADENTAISDARGQVVAWIDPNFKFFFKYGIFDDVFLNSSTCTLAGDTPDSSGDKDDGFYVGMEPEVVGSFNRNCVVHVANGTNATEIVPQAFTVTIVGDGKETTGTISCTVDWDSEGGLFFLHKYEVTVTAEFQEEDDAFKASVTACNVITTLADRPLEDGDTFEQLFVFNGATALASSFLIICVALLAAA